MGLILKIAAGIIIGLLFVQILILKYVSYEGERLTEKLVLTSQLRMKSTILMNSVHLFYKKNNRLPKDISDLNCGDTLCATAEINSVFYVKHDMEWMVIEPYIASRKVRFHCKSTLVDYSDVRFQHCIKINKPEIPLFWLKQKSHN